MKKVLSITGIVISGFGLLGALMMITEGDGSGFSAILLFGLYMAISIMLLNNK